MIEIALGGLATTQKAYDLLFGFECQLLKDLSQTDPIFGGDPSIISTVGLALNQSQEEAHRFARQSIYTGKKDIDWVRRYHTLNNLTSINLIRPYFNGNETLYEQINPWEVSIPINTGTDAMFFHPNIDKNKQLGATVIDLLRTCVLNYQRTIDYFGIDVYKFTVDDHFYDVNSTFHNDRWVGLINFTEALQAPVFMSFRHILHGDPALHAAVEIYKVGGSEG